MTTLRTLEQDEPLDVVDDELRETQLQTAASPLTAALSAPFVEARQDLVTVRAQEVQLEDDLRSAEARAHFVDDELNAIADETKVAVLAAVDNNHEAPLHRQLFAGQTPSELKRPILGEQLATQRVWVAPLLESTNPTLHAIGQRLEDVVERADEVLGAQAVARQRLDQFRLGARKTFIEHCNALRKLTHGQLGEIAHSHPELKLSASFPARFFLHAHASRMPTITEVRRGVEHLRKQLARKEAQLAELESKQARADQARAEAALEERRQKLAAAEQKAAEAAAELAALQAELGRAQASVSAT